jgi:hypothetical protein
MIEKMYGVISIQTLVSLDNKSDREKYNLDKSEYKFAPWTFKFKKYDCVLHAKDKSLIDSDCDGDFDINSSGEPLGQPVSYSLKKRKN